MNDEGEKLAPSPCSAIKCDHCGNDAEFRADNRKAVTHGWQFVCYPCSWRPVFYNVQPLEQPEAETPLESQTDHTTGQGSDGGSDHRLVEPSSELIEEVKKDIKAVASIYPTAFDLYDDPLERLAHRVCRTILRHNAGDDAPR